MQVVRRLWAVCVSVGIILLSAFPSALAVNTQGWYQTLTLPSFALSESMFTPLWAIAYLTDIIALSSLFSTGAQGLRLYLPVAAGVPNVFWCYLFFTFNALISSTVLLAAMVAYAFSCALLNFTKNKLCAAMFFVKTAWFSYLFAVVVATVCA